LKYKIGILKRQENIRDFPYLSKALYSHSRTQNIIHNSTHKLLKRQHNVTDIQLPIQDDETYNTNFVKCVITYNFPTTTT